MCVLHSSFSGSFLREWLLSCLSQSTDRTQHTLDIWGPLKTKELGGLLLLLRTCGTADRGQWKERRSMHPKVLLFKELHKGLVSVLANLQRSWDLGYSEAWGLLRRAGRLAAAPENL